jgi:hypothetical protein
MLRGSQLASFDDFRGARTLMVLAAMGLAIGFYFTAQAFVTPVRAMLLAILLASSGVGVLAAGPIQSDGLALAFGTAALALLLTGNGRWRPYAAGAALGAALAVKSLHVIPVLVVIVVLLWSKRDWRNAVAATSTATGTIVIASLPFGLGRVWDQYVLFHLAKDNTLNIVDNVSEGARGLWNFDLGVVVVVTVLIAAVFIKSHTGAHEMQPAGPRWLPPTWLAFSVLLLAVFTPVGSGFTRAMIYLIPPLLLIAAMRSRLPTVALTILVGFAMIWQFTSVDFVRGFGPGPDDNAIIAQLKETPEDRYIVSDDPGIVWAAGRLSHPVSVDPSFARFDTGYLTPQDVESALADPLTCAYVAISGRFEANTVEPPADYAATDIQGVYVRDGC